MTKTELIDNMSKGANISKAAAGQALAAAIESIKKTVKRGNKVVIIGFGTFSLAKRKARKGRNPNTGAVLKIAASRTVRFSAGKALKDAVS